MGHQAVIRNNPPPLKMRETGAICQIGVFTAEQSIFGHFRRFRTAKIVMLSNTVFGRHSLKT